MHNRQRSRLQLEALEPRHLCAGNVTAVLSDGNLTIQGDKLNNCLSVESAGEGRIQVRGFGTKVNGSADAIRVFSGVTGGVFIRTRNGDDLVRVTNVILPGKLVIDLGSGNDEAVTGHDKPNGNERFGGTPTGHLATYGEARILGRLGDDLLYQSYYHAKLPALLDMGDGNDVIRMERFPAENRDMQYRGKLSIYMGAGKDRLYVDGLLAQSNVVVRDDEGQLNMTWRWTTIEGACWVQLGTGWDIVELAVVRANRLTVKGGAGNDQMSIKSTTAIDAFFAGEEGTDTFRDSLWAPNRFTTLTRTGFETIERTT